MNLTETELDRLAKEHPNAKSVLRAAALLANSRGENEPESVTLQLPHELVVNLRLMADEMRCGSLPGGSPEDTFDQAVSRLAELAIRGYQTSIGWA